MDYLTWRICYQDSEQAARAAFSEAQQLRAELADLKAHQIAVELSECSLRAELAALRQQNPEQQWEHAKFVMRVLEAGNAATDKDRADAYWYVKQFRDVTHSAACQQAGEPVGYVAREVIEGLQKGCRWGGARITPKIDLEDGTTHPLYLAPPATVPAVPDKRQPLEWRESSEQKLAETSYCEGWNACRAAMLAAAPEVPSPPTAVTPEDLHKAINEFAVACTFDHGLEARVKAADNIKSMFAYVQPTANAREAIDAAMAKGGER